MAPYADPKHVSTIKTDVSRPIGLFLLSLLRWRSNTTNHGTQRDANSEGTNFEALVRAANYTDRATAPFRRS
jgi:hypothetical protein